MIDSVKKWYNTNVAVNNSNKVTKTQTKGVTFYTNNSTNTTTAKASSFSIKDAVKRGTIDTAVTQIRREINEFKEIIRINQELISDYQNASAIGGKTSLAGMIGEKAAATALSVAYSAIRSDVLKVRKLADTFASNMDDPKGGEAIAAAVQGLIDAIMGLLTPLNSIGFPELPIIGDLGELLKKMRRIKEAMPDDTKSQMSQQQDENGKKGINLTNLLPRDLLLDIESIVEDVKTICSNLQLIPVTLLGMAVMVLVNAVTDIFDTIGLGTFDFDGLMKSSPLKFDLDFSVLPDIAAEAPNWTTLEALAQSIPMILMAVTNLPGMVSSAIKNLIADIYTILNSMDILKQQTDVDQMIAQLEFDTLSCTKNIQCDNMRINYLSLKKTLSELETQQSNLGNAKNVIQDKINDEESSTLKRLIAAQELQAIDGDATRLSSELSIVQNQIKLKNTEIEEFKKNVNSTSAYLSTYMSVPADNVSSSSKFGKPMKIEIPEKAWKTLSATVNAATASDSSTWKAASSNAKLSWQAGTKL